MSKALEAARKALAEKGRTPRKRVSLLDNKQVQDKILLLEREAPSLVNAYTAAMDGRSRTLAIKVFCVECMGYVRSEVRLCTSPTCPLYPYRPFQSNGDEEDGEELEEGE